MQTVQVVVLNWSEFEPRLLNLENRVEELLQRQQEQSEKASPPPAQSGPVFLVKKDAARLLLVCPNTLDNYARAGRIARHYVGKKVLYDRDEVLALVQAHKGTKAKKH